MNRRILIDGTFPNQCRVALVNSSNKLDDLEYESSNISQIKGNIYLAKVVRVEPGLQAAFIDYGQDKNGFLPFSEIHPGYYNIPIADTPKYSSELSNLQEISTSKLTSADMQEPHIKVAELNLEGEIDISLIEKFIDEDNNSDDDADLDKSDDNIEPLPIYKQYKIQEVIKKGQVILVQALKEERGNKGASFSSYISLAGKYCVLMPNNPGHHGISRKISHSEERRRLRDLVSKLLTDEDAKIASIIVRTAGINKSTADIQRDYEYLVRLWNHIREATLKSRAPNLIHVEEGVIQKTIRDLYDYSVNEIVVEGEEAFDSAVEFMARILPNDVKKVKKHSSLVPIFASQNIESQVASLYQQTVHLPSGGYIVINPTEALTSIDVNSGTSTSERNIEETALKTNVEAAREIARQIRIRDISGLIVVDFIDMGESRNRKIVERSMKEYVARDKAKIHISNISAFGLLEMSRQRLRPSFLESHTRMCSHCNGKGIVRDDEANSMVILRTIENEISNLDADIVNIYGSMNVILYILNNKRFEVAIIEEKYGVKINCFIDNSVTSDSFSIEKIILPADNRVVDESHASHAAPMVEEAKATTSVKRESQGRRRKWKDGDKAQKNTALVEEKPMQVETDIEAPQTTSAPSVLSSAPSSASSESEQAPVAGEEVKKSPPKRSRNRRSKLPKAQVDNSAV